MIGRCGTSEDGKIVISGAFKFLDTYGLPLAVIIDQLRTENMGFCVVCFIRDAEKAGWNPNKIKTTLLEGIIDAPSDVRPDIEEVESLIVYTLTHPEVKH